MNNFSIDAILIFTKTFDYPGFELFIHSIKVRYGLCRKVAKCHGIRGAVDVEHEKIIKRK